MKHEITDCFELNTTHVRNLISSCRNQVSGPGMDAHPDAGHGHVRDDTQPGGPRTIQRRFVALFVRANRKVDYRVAWAFF
jgi:hypothetical protein